jgi:hypothetical protein
LLLNITRQIHGLTGGLQKNAAGTAGAMSATAGVYRDSMFAEHFQETFRRVGRIQVDVPIQLARRSQNSKSLRSGHISIVPVGEAWLQE